MMDWPAAKVYLLSLPRCRERDMLLDLATGKCLLKRNQPKDPSQFKDLRSLIRNMARQEKRDSFPALKKELDRVFSIFIRRRGVTLLAQQSIFGSESGLAQCVACGYVAPWSEMDCGHYRPRQDMNTRWDEKNCHVQCSRCNAFRGGEPEKMAQYIDNLYGEGTASRLRLKSAFKVRLDRQWMKSHIAFYNGKIGEG